MSDRATVVLLLLAVLVVGLAVGLLAGCAEVRDEAPPAASAERMPFEGGPDSR